MGSCMFSYQDCLNYNSTAANQTCLAEECSASHLTTITYDELESCATGETDDVSKWAVDSGLPLWIKVDNMTVFDNWKDESHEIKNWAAGVFSAACNRIEYLGGTKPMQCDSVLANTIIQTGAQTLQQANNGDGVSA